MSPSAIKDICYMSNPVVAVSFTHGFQCMTGTVSYW